MDASSISPNVRPSHVTLSSLLTPSVSVNPGINMHDLNLSSEFSVEHWYHTEFPHVYDSKEMKAPLVTWISLPVVS